MNDFQQVLLDINNGVATIKLNNPTRLNAFTQTMRLELIQAIEQVETDEQVRVVVLTGAGRAFSAGADLTDGLSGHASFVEQCEAEYTPWLMAIHNSSKLYIAAVNGACAGISSAAAMNCDLMIMADDAYLYQAFSAIGLMPDGGANWLLLQKLGYARALEMAVDAGRLTAEQALDVGIANKVVAADSLLTQAQAWAEKLAQGAPLAQAATKKLMRRAFTMNYAEVLQEESVIQSKLIESEDARQAAKAFLAKEKPVFKGK